MILFPNCKINLGLHITRKREDGYHDLETVFYPLALQDALEAIRNTATGDQVSLSVTGIPVAGDPEDNLCIKAYRLLKKDFPEIGSVQMHLHKAIPMGAGLGGGSSDGAFALRLLDQLFHLGLSTDQLLSYALQLGSDCPFFVLNKPVYATGRGEKMQAIELDLSAYRFVIVHPGIHISTAEAFAGIQPKQPVKPLTAIVSSPVEHWKETLQNDFEETVCRKHPQIAQISQQLYKAGAVYASMTGSGSAVFGMFAGAVPSSLNLPSHYSTNIVG